MQLTTPRLVLREFRASDCAAVHAYEGHPETQRYEKPVPTQAATRAYVDEAIRWSQEAPRTHYRLAITQRGQDIARGRVSLKPNYVEIREWEIGWTVHYQDWGHGYATEAARAMLGLAFDELHAHRVVAFCHAANLASQRVMEKLGMQPEAHLRETRWLDGAWHDEVLYAILEWEWQALFKQTAQAG